MSNAFINTQIAIQLARRNVLSSPTMGMVRELPECSHIQEILQSILSFAPYADCKEHNGR